MLTIHKLFAGLLFFTVSAWAQGSHGYGFLGPGSITGRGAGTTIHAGGGGELLTNLGVGIGAEAGYLFPAESPDNGIGTASVNGYYHFLQQGRAQWDPFVTGGYSGLFRSGYASAGNYGGGINYWVNDRFGVKIEFRDHVHSPRGGAVHYWNVRFGLNFR